MKIELHLLLSVVLALSVGCNPDYEEIRADVDPLDAVVSRGARVYHTDALPISQLLRRIEDSSELSQREKRQMATIISGNEVYAHGRVELYTYAGERYLLIDQLRPERTVGTDAEGHTLAEGGSGTKTLFHLVGGKWTSVVTVHYG